MRINNIFKNFSSLFVSNIVINLLSFFYTLLLARYLGVEGFGALSLAIAFGGIFGIITDLGLGALTTRNVSRKKSESAKYLSNILVIRLGFAFMTFIVAVLCLNFLDYPSQTKYIIYLITISFIISAITSTYYSIFQSYEKMEFQAFGQTLNAVLLFLGIFVAINFKLDLISIAYIYLLSNLIVLFINMIISPVFLNIKLIKIEKKFCKSILQQVMPFTLALIFSIVYFRVDTILLSLLNGEVAVGIYTAPYKLMEALTFIPIVFTTAVFPLFSKFHIESKESLKISYEKTFRYLLIIAIPISIITTFYANNIITIVYGSSFESSIIPLQILIWTLPLLFCTYLFRILLISMNKQNLVFKLILICLLFNVILNLILIPKYSYIGSSIVNVLTEFIFFTISFYYIGKYLQKTSFRSISKILLSGIVIILIIISFNGLNTFIILLISIIAYISALFYLKIITKDELKKIIIK